MSLFDWFTSDDGCDGGHLWEDQGLCGAWSATRRTKHFVPTTDIEINRERKYTCQLSGCHETKYETETYCVIDESVLDQLHDEQKERDSE